MHQPAAPAAEQLAQVVDQVDQDPLGSDVGLTAQADAAEAATLLVLTEDRFGYDTLIWPHQGADRDAVAPSPTVCLPGPPSEPDVRVATHPALHESISSGYPSDLPG